MYIHIHNIYNLYIYISQSKTVPCSSHHIIVGSNKWHVETTSFNSSTAGVKVEVFFCCSIVLDACTQFLDFNSSTWGHKADIKQLMSQVSVVISDHRTWATFLKPSRGWIFSAVSFLASFRSSCRDAKIKDDIGGNWSKWVFLLWEEGEILCEILSEILDISWFILV